MEEIVPHGALFLCFDDLFSLSLTGFAPTLSHTTLRASLWDDEKKRHFVSEQLVPLQKGRGLLQDGALFLAMMIPVTKGDRFVKKNLAEPALIEVSCSDSSCAPLVLKRYFLAPNCIRREVDVVFGGFRM